MHYSTNNSKHNLASMPENTNDQNDLIQHIQTGLTSNDHETQINSAFTLGLFGKTAAASLKHLLVMAKNQNKQLRAAAITAIGQINSYPNKSIPVLNWALLDTDITIRQSAATGLALFSIDDLNQYDSIYFIRKSISQDSAISTYLNGLLMRVSHISINK